jgi:hypothetical protein
MKTTTTKTLRKPAAKPISAMSGPAIAEETLKDIAQVAHAQPSLPQEGKLVISMDTFVQAINTANMSYKFAFYMEMAVCLAMFAEAGDTSKDAKKSLYEVYARAGYDCKDITSSEYKTVNRRINAGAALFDWLGKDKVNSWLAGTAEMTSLNAIVKQLEFHNLRGINSVLALTGKPVALPRDKAKIDASRLAEASTQVSNAPAPAAPQEPSGAAKAVAEGVGVAIEQSRQERAVGGQEKHRRVEDKEGVLVFSSEHVKVSVSPNATRQELINLATELLQFAATLDVVEENATAH